MVAPVPLMGVPSREATIQRGAEVIRIEAEALKLLAESLSDSFADACETILNASGRIVVSGMGKSGHIGRKWAATLAATGTPATYVHPAEAAHGDLGMLVKGDVLVILSNSGNTRELVALLKYASDIDVPVIGVAARPNSLVMQAATIKLQFPAAHEACRSNIAPTTSTTLQLALGDAVAMAVMDMRGFSRDGMKALHPGGSIGLRLTPVSEMMHSNNLPLVEEATPMREVIVTMTASGFGTAGVCNSAGQLVGVITDGDLRRHFDEMGSSNAVEVMTPNPKILPSHLIAEDALAFLNEHNITSAFVVDADARLNKDTPIGIVHVHDFLRVGLS